jgi:hypothetical protein
MHLLKLFLFTLPSITFFTLFASTSAQAACVDTDASVQVALRNQAKATPQQTNTVESDISDDCFGNTATTTNNQVYFGNGDEIIQQRDRYVEMDTPNAQSLPVNTPNIQTGVGIQMDVPLPLNLKP